LAAVGTTAFGVAVPATARRRVVVFLVDPLPIADRIDASEVVWVNRNLDQERAQMKVSEQIGNALRPRRGLG